MQKENSPARKKKKVKRRKNRMTEQSDENSPIILGGQRNATSVLLSQPENPDHGRKGTTVINYFADEADETERSKNDGIKTNPDDKEEEEEEESDEEESKMSDEKNDHLNHNNNNNNKQNIQQS